MSEITNTAREVIGQFLEERRKELGLTYYQLRQQTGLQHNQIISIFEGSINYTIDSLLQITVALKIYLFFGEKDGKKDVPLDADHMVEQIKKSDPYTTPPQN